MSHKKITKRFRFHCNTYAEDNKDDVCKFSSFESFKKFCLKHGQASWGHVGDSFMHMCCYCLTCDEIKSGKVTAIPEEMLIKS